MKKTFLTVSLFLFFASVFPQRVFAQSLSGPTTVEAYTPFIINVSGLTVSTCYAYKINSSAIIVLPLTPSLASACYTGKDSHDIYYSFNAQVTDTPLAIEGQQAGTYFIAIGGQRNSSSNFAPIKTITVNIVIPPTPTSAPTPTPGGPTLTPTPPTTCNPSGTDPLTGMCLDRNCEKNTSGICVRKLILPTSPLSVSNTPVPSPTSIAPPFPCANKVGDECKAVGTAIGNIETDPALFIKKIFTVLLSMAGGWATYLIIVAGYKLMFSHGEAEAVKEAKEEITSAIVGIIFMLLSLVILRVIGVDIFGIPTFK